MKLKANIPDIEVPPVGLLEWLCIDERRYGPERIQFMLQQISPSELLDLREEEKEPLRAMPIYFAKLDFKTIGLYPTPDREYEARLRFYPPMEEI